jgi:hypothetical protein
VRASAGTPQSTDRVQRAPRRRAAHQQGGSGFAGRPSNVRSNTSTEGKSHAIVSQYASSNLGADRLYCLNLCETTAIKADHLKFEIIFH